MKNIILILMLAILLSGCSISAPSFGTVSGVNVKFDVDNPPASIDVGDDFGVELTVSNPSSCQITQGRICISDSIEGDGVEDNECSIFQLAGLDKTREDSKTPKQTIITFSDYVYASPLVSKGMSYDNTISASLEYPCTVDIRPNVCVKYDQDYMGNKDYKCNSKETFTSSDFGNNIAPLTITNIKKHLRKVTGEGVELNLEIKVQKKSSGVPKTIEGFDQFKMDITYQGEKMNCGEDIDEGGIVKLELQDTEKVIKCEKLVYYTGTEHDTGDLNIRLDYVYADSYTKRIVIKNPI